LETFLDAVRVDRALCVDIEAVHYARGWTVGRKHQAEERRRDENSQTCTKCFILKRPLALVTYFTHQLIH